MSEKVGKTGEVRDERKFLTASFVPSNRETSRVITNAPSPEPHLGWHSRGYLPHWDHPGMMQSVSLRLHDAMPREVVEKRELGARPACLPGRKGGSK